MFSIADGPILSIRFHPFVLPSDERIGLLAVTTANQCVHVYSLPYLKTSVDDSNENLVISLEPSIICKLSEKDILFQNKYLMQVSTVNWYYREGEIQLLAAGYISGYVAIWMIDEDCSGNETISLLPYLVFKPHTEIITALDFKSSMDYDFLLLTSSNDREAKVFAVENGQLQEISSSHNTSRVSCAEWCLNWPVYIFGIDQCFMFGSIAFRQPVEFGTRSQVLLQSFSAVIDLSMNHWLNYIIFICDSGDVLAVNPPQLLHANPKDRWRGFGNTILSYTDIIDIDSTGECGIVFSDIKVI
jgi:WD40 repeat protein